MNQSAAPSHRAAGPPWPRLAQQRADIRALWLLFVVSGAIGLGWISSYPDYALKGFWDTVRRMGGWAMKLQHPLIHWLIGWGLY